MTNYRKLIAPLSFTVFVLIGSLGWLLFSDDLARDAWVLFSGVIALAVGKFVESVILRNEKD